jgi:hypothetical protein
MFRWFYWPAPLCDGRLKSVDIERFTLIPKPLPVNAAALLFFSVWLVVAGTLHSDSVIVTQPFWLLLVDKNHIVK